MSQTCSWSWYESGSAYLDPSSIAKTGTSQSTPLACISDEPNRPYIEWSKGYMNNAVYGYEYMNATTPTEPKAFQYSDYGTDSYFGQSPSGFACEPPDAAGLQKCGNVTADDDVYCVFSFDTRTGHTYLVGSGYDGLGIEATGTNCNVGAVGIDGGQNGTGAAACCVFNLAYCAELDDTNSYCKRAQCVFTHNATDPGGGTAEPSESTSTLLNYRVLDTWVARSGYGASISPRCACNNFGVGPEAIYDACGGWTPSGDCTNPYGDLAAMDVVMYCDGDDATNKYKGMPCVDALTSTDPGCTCGSGQSPLWHVFQDGVLKTANETIDEPDGLAGLSSSTTLNNPFCIFANDKTGKATCLGSSEETTATLNTVPSMPFCNVSWSWSARQGDYGVGTSDDKYAPAQGNQIDPVAIFTSDAGGAGKDAADVSNPLCGELNDSCLEYTLGDFTPRQNALGCGIAGGCEMITKDAAGTATPQLENICKINNKPGGSMGIGSAWLHNEGPELQGSTRQLLWAMDDVNVVRSGADSHYGTPRNSMTETGSNAYLGIVNGSPSDETLMPYRATTALVDAMTDKAVSDGKITTEDKYNCMVDQYCKLDGVDSATQCAFGSEDQAKLSPNANKSDNALTTNDFMDRLGPGGGTRGFLTFGANIYSAFNANYQDQDDLHYCGWGVPTDALDGTVPTRHSIFYADWTDGDGSGWNCQNDDNQCRCDFSVISKCRPTNVHSDDSSYPYSYDSTLTVQDCIDKYYPNDSEFHVYTCPMGYENAWKHNWGTNSNPYGDWANPYNGYDAVQKKGANHAACPHGGAGCCVQSADPDVSYCQYNKPKVASPYYSGEVGHPRTFRGPGDPFQTPLYGPSDLCAKATLNNTNSLDITGTKIYTSSMGLNETGLDRKVYGRGADLSYNMEYCANQDGINPSWSVWDAWIQSTDDYSGTDGSGTDGSGADSVNSVNSGRNVSSDEDDTFFYGVPIILHDANGKVAPTGQTFPLNEQEKRTDAEHQNGTPWTPTLGLFGNENYYNNFRHTKASNHSDTGGSALTYQYGKQCRNDMFSNPPLRGEETYSGDTMSYEGAGAGIVATSTSMGCNNNAAKNAFGAIQCPGWNSAYSANCPTAFMPPQWWSCIAEASGNDTGLDACADRPPVWVKDSSHYVDQGIGGILNYLSTQGDSGVRVMDQFRNTLRRDAGTSGPGMCNWAVFAGPGVRCRNQDKDKMAVQSLYDDAGSANPEYGSINTPDSPNSKLAKGFGTQARQVCHSETNGEATYTTCDTEKQVGFSDYTNAVSNHWKEDSCFNYEADDLSSGPQSFFEWDMTNGTIISGVITNAGSSKGYGCSPFSPDGHNGGRAVNGGCGQGFNAEYPIGLAGTYDAHNNTCHLFDVADGSDNKWAPYVPAVIEGQNAYPGTDDELAMQLGTACTKPDLIKPNGAADNTGPCGDLCNAITVPSECPTGVCIWSADASECQPIFPDARCCASGTGIIPAIFEAVASNDGNNVAYTCPSAYTDTGSENTVSSIRLKKTSTATLYGELLGRMCDGVLGDNTCGTNSCAFSSDMCGLPQACIDVNDDRVGSCVNNSDVPCVEKTLTYEWIGCSSETETTCTNPNCYLDDDNACKAATQDVGNPQCEARCELQCAGRYGVDRYGSGITQCSDLSDESTCNTAFETSGGTGTPCVWDEDSNMCTTASNDTCSVAVDTSGYSNMYEPVWSCTDSASTGACKAPSDGNTASYYADTAQCPRHYQPSGPSDVDYDPCANLGLSCTSDSDCQNDALIDALTGSGDNPPASFAAAYSGRCLPGACYGMNYANDDDYDTSVQSNVYYEACSPAATSKGSANYTCGISGSTRSGNAIPCLFMNFSSGSGGSDGSGSDGSGLSTDTTVDGTPPQGWPCGGEAETCGVCAYSGMACDEHIDATNATTNQCAQIASQSSTKPVSGGFCKTAALETTCNKQSAGLNSPDKDACSAGATASCQADTCGCGSYNSLSAGVNTDLDTIANMACNQPCCGPSAPLDPALVDLIYPDLSTFNKSDNTFWRDYNNNDSGANAWDKYASLGHDVASGCDGSACPTWWDTARNNTTGRCAVPVSLRNMCSGFGRGAASRAACLDVDPQLETQWTTLINSNPVPPDIETGAMTVYVAAAPNTGVIANDNSFLTGTHSNILTKSTCCCSKCSESGDGTCYKDATSTDNEQSSCGTSCDLDCGKLTLTNAHFCTYVGDTDERYVCGSGSPLGSLGKWCGSTGGSGETGAADCGDQGSCVPSELGIRASSANPYLRVMGMNPGEGNVKDTNDGLIPYPGDNTNNSASCWAGGAGGQCAFANFSSEPFSADLLASPFDVFKPCSTVVPTAGGTDDANMGQLDYGAGCYNRPVPATGTFLGNVTAGDDDTSILAMGKAWTTTTSPTSALGMCGMQATNFNERGLYACTSQRGEGEYVYTACMFDVENQNNGNVMGSFVHGLDPGIGLYDGVGPSMEQKYCRTPKGIFDETQTIPCGSDDDCSGAYSTCAPKKVPYGAGSLWSSNTALQRYARLPGTCVSSDSGKAKAYQTTRCALKAPSGALQDDTFRWEVPTDLLEYAAASSSDGSGGIEIAYIAEAPFTGFGSVRTCADLTDDSGAVCVDNSYSQDNGGINTFDKIAGLDSTSDLSPDLSSPLFLPGDFEPCKSAAASGMRAVVRPPDLGCSDVVEDRNNPPTTWPWSAGCELMATGGTGEYDQAAPKMQTDLLSGHWRRNTGCRRGCTQTQGGGCNCSNGARTLSSPIPGYEKNYDTLLSDPSNHRFVYPYACIDSNLGDVCVFSYNASDSTWREIPLVNEFGHDCNDLFTEYPSTGLDVNYLTCGNQWYESSSEKLCLDTFTRSSTDEQSYAVDYYVNNQPVQATNGCPVFVDGTRAFDVGIGGYGLVLAMGDASPSGANEVLHLDSDTGTYQVGASVSNTPSKTRYVGDQTSTRCVYDVSFLGSDAASVQQTLRGAGSSDATPEAAGRSRTTGLRTGFSETDYVALWHALRMDMMVNAPMVGEGNSALHPHFSSSVTETPSCPDDFSDWESVTFGPSGNNGMNCREAPTSSTSTGGAGDPGGRDHWACGADNSAPFYVGPAELHENYQLWSDISWSFCQRPIDGTATIETALGDGGASPSYVTSSTTARCLNKNSDVSTGVRASGGCSMLMADNGPGTDVSSGDDYDKSTGLVNRTEYGAPSICRLWWQTLTDPDRIKWVNEMCRNNSNLAECTVVNRARLRPECVGCAVHLGDVSTLEDLVENYDNCNASCFDNTAASTDALTTNWPFAWAPSFINEDFGLFGGNVTDGNVNYKDLPPTCWYDPMVTTGVDIGGDALESNNFTLNCPPTTLSVQNMTWWTPVISDSAYGDGVFAPSQSAFTGEPCCNFTMCVSGISIENSSFSSLSFDDINMQTCCNSSNSAAECQGDAGVGGMCTTFSLDDPAHDPTCSDGSGCAATMQTCCGASLDGGGELNEFFAGSAAGGETAAANCCGLTSVVDGYGYASGDATIARTDGKSKCAVACMNSYAGLSASDARAAGSTVATRNCLPGVGGCFALYDAPFGPSSSSNAYQPIDNMPSSSSFQLKNGSTNCIPPSTANPNGVDFTTNQEFCNSMALSSTQCALYSQGSDAICSTANGGCTANSMTAIPMVPCECPIKVCTSAYDGTSDATNAMSSVLSATDGFCLTNANGAALDDIRQCYEWDDDFATPTTEECTLDNPTCSGDRQCGLPWFGYTSAFVDRSTACTTATASTDCDSNICVTEQDQLRLWQRAACGGIFKG